MTTEQAAENLFAVSRELRERQVRNLMALCHCDRARAEELHNRLSNRLSNREPQAAAYRVGKRFGRALAGLSQRT